MRSPLLLAAVSVATLAAGVTAGAAGYTLISDPTRLQAAPPAPTPTIAAAATSSVATPTPTPTRTAAATKQTQRSAPPRERPLPTRSQLRRIARAAALDDGRVQIAVTRSGKRGVLAAASSGSTRTPFRMWSVSKPATAIALLDALGWTDHAGQPLRADVDAAMHSALVRSGDCAQRQLVVELQDATGSIAAARAAVQRVLARAGTRTARVLDRAAPAGSGCRPYLAHTRTPDPYRTALQLGTAEWAVTDAARFALALGDGTYPRAITRRIIRLLTQPKRHSDDPFANGLDVTSRLDWGAGRALADLDPAYKAGWGGSSGETPSFVNEQVIHIRSHTGFRYGIAITYEPATIPGRDDPGLTRAPIALQRALNELRKTLDL